MYTREEIEKRVKEGQSCARLDLRGINFDGAYLSGGDFSYANFEGCSMRGVNLSNANLQGANLRGVDFSPLKKV